MSTGIEPWERRNEYYKNIKLGDNIRNQTAAISRQTHDIIEGQINSTNKIVASNEAIIESIDSLSYGIDAVSNGISGLSAAFEWGISEVIWQIEQNREVLTNILSVIQAPLDTQSKEFKRRAIEAFNHGWIEDAEEEYLNSEKANKYDFSIHISLGIIYLKFKNNKDKAIEYFDKAIKYARPKSSYYTSYALLYKGLIQFQKGQISDAAISAEEAVSLSYEMLEAHYQCAQYNCCLNNVSKSINHLEISIIGDFNYCFKIENDEIFDNIREEIFCLITKLMNKILSVCTARLKVEQYYMDKLNILIDNIDKLNIEELNLCKLKYINCSDKISKANIKINNLKYLDSIQANDIIIKIDSDIRNSINHNMINIKKLLNNLELTARKNTKKNINIYGHDFPEDNNKKINLLKNNYLNYSNLSTDYISRYDKLDTDNMHEDKYSSGVTNNNSQNKTNKSNAEKYFFIIVFIIIASLSIFYIKREFEYMKTRESNAKIYKQMFDEFYDKFKVFLYANNRKEIYEMMSDEFKYNNLNKISKVQAIKLLDSNGKWKNLKNVINGEVVSIVDSYGNKGHWYSVSKESKPRISLIFKTDIRGKYKWCEYIED